MTQPITLSGTVSAQIGAFLYSEGFATDNYTAQGIFEIINLISDYQEEGKVLFPEVLITNDLDLLKAIPDHKVEIETIPASRDAFKKVIKYCAPLCNASWVIFIEIKDGRLRYGVSCAEITETSPSLYNQTVGEIAYSEEGWRVAYIRNVGNKTVELKGLKTSVLISLSLSAATSATSGELLVLAQQICRDTHESIRESAVKYYQKVLVEGLKEGHGNLIVVVEGNTTAIQAVKTAHPDAIYLPTPINLAELLLGYEASKSAEDATALRQHSFVVKAMCNNDGIAVFTTRGELIAYHLMLQGDFTPAEVKPTINGGARTRTFFNLLHCGHFCFGLMKSQDGPIKIFPTS